MSTPTKRRPSSRAATPVVPLPTKGSSTRPPFSLADRMMRRSRARGFCVGCLPCSFSALRGAWKRHTDFICLPPFSSFMSW